jgi:hypothetical protein
LRAPCKVFTTPSLLPPCTSMAYPCTTKIGELKALIASNRNSRAPFGADDAVAETARSRIGHRAGVEADAAEAGVPIPGPGALVRLPARGGIDMRELQFSLIADLLIDARLRRSEAAIFECEVRKHHFDRDGTCAAHPVAHHRYRQLR